MIVIIDYGVGNLRSILTKFERMKIAAMVSSQETDIARADRLVLPGVGHFGAGMANLRRSGLIPLIEDMVFERRTPLLGICLGMQMLTRGSEESGEPGLGWIAGAARKFAFPEGDRRLRVPHMGWNRIAVRHPSALTDGLPADARFYFAHSYYVATDAPSDVVATTWYGADFASVIQHGYICGTQFHPEKSHQAGLRVIYNFARAQNGADRPPVVSAEAVRHDRLK